MGEVQIFSERFKGIHTNPETPVKWTGTQNVSPKKFFRGEVRGVKKANYG